MMMYPLDLWIRVSLCAVLALPLPSFFFFFSPTAQQQLPLSHQPVWNVIPAEEIITKVRWRRVRAFVRACLGGNGGSGTLHTLHGRKAEKRKEERKYEGEKYPTSIWRLWFFWKQSEPFFRTFSRTKIIKLSSSLCLNFITQPCPSLKLSFFRTSSY